MVNIIRCYKTKNAPTLTLCFRDASVYPHRDLLLQKTDTEAETIARRLAVSGKWRVTPGLSMMGEWVAVRISLLEKAGKL